MITRRRFVSDDHHLFVSLGCATENLIQGALAHGFHGDARFDSALDLVRVTLEPTPAQPSSLVRFGRGPLMPRSLRRPVNSLLV